MAGGNLRLGPGGKSGPRLSFLWHAKTPTKCLVTGASADMIGTRATGRGGPYIDLSANASTQSFSVPLPQAQYTVIVVFVPIQSSGGALALCRTTTNGFRADLATTSGGINALQVTNNGATNGAALVATVDAFDTHPWCGITTYDGSTIASWLAPLNAAGANEIITTGSVGSAGYTAPTGTFDFANGSANSGLQLVAMSDYAMPTSQVLGLLRDPMGLLQPGRRRLVWAPSANNPTNQIAWITA